jgi:ribonuclease HI
MITVWTDGSCLGNPGYGGWAWYAPDRGVLPVSHSGYVRYTTNNRMELQAIAEALTDLMGEQNLKIVTDSQWSINVITRKWKAKINLDVLRKIWEILKSYSHVEFKWVKAHATSPQNNYVDQMARSAALHARTL